MLYAITELTQQYTPLKQYISNGAIPEPRAKLYFREIITAIHYAHHIAGLIHGHINAENLLIDCHNSVKINDYLSASMLFHYPTPKVKAEYMLYQYTPPEIINGGTQHEENDIWQCGIILYYMLKGALPFDKVPTEQLIPLILEKEPDYSGIKAEPRNLLQQMLKKDFNKRITINQLIVNEL